MNDIHSPGINGMTILMDLNDFLNANIGTLAAIRALDLKDLDHNMWESLKESAGELQGFLEALKESAQYSAKVITNDAAFAHISTVMLADD